MMARPSDTHPNTSHVHALPIEAREEALSLFAENGKISKENLRKLDLVLDFVSDYFCHCYMDKS